MKIVPGNVEMEPVGSAPARLKTLTVGEREQQQPSGFQEAARLAERFDWPGQMFQDMPEYDDVEIFLRITGLRKIAYLEAYPFRFKLFESGKLDNVIAVRLSAQTVHPGQEVRPSPAPHVKHAAAPHVAQDPLHAAQP